MRAFLLFVIVGLFLTFNSRGQVSQGGDPLKAVHLKSSVSKVVEMPSFDLKILKKSVVSSSSEKKIKPLKFAYAFNVSLTPKNSGEWLVADDGTLCWKLKIRSKGAKSLNLIFNRFKLPENSRLFIFNENTVLGAFTPVNNKTSGKFAVAPIAGDEITVQYETKERDIENIPFEIKSVNHDFVGILEKGDRRPMGKTAGECNIDINCDLGDKWSEVKNSVCRIIVNGVEICTGSLVNNTAEDEKPYIISASHCYDKWEYAETSVYVFNYESPFCAPLDGDPRNSVSGAIMKAQFDSLDFALAELTLVPPPNYRPYFAGWERTVELRDSSASIHHPQGDIKKIALDYDAPSISDFTSSYIKNGFLKIARWDEGVTEVGSSGGPLFDKNKNIIGTLTGGIASCGNPVKDYFERFALSWDYKSEDSLQLKHWLDPINSDVKTLNGKRFYEKEEYCGAFTNLNDDDKYKLVQIDITGPFAGYWGGTNSTGVTEFTERFSISGNEQLDGISLGVGLIKTASSDSNSEITIKVYNGTNAPEELIYSKKVQIKDLFEGAMNYIGFDDVVEPADTFFVGFEMSNTQPTDSFAIYQSLRGPNTDNYFYYKQNENWRNFEDFTSGYQSMANVIELVACNIDDSPSDTPIVNNPMEIIVYPNPSTGIITVEAGKEIETKEVSVVNIIGQNIYFQIEKVDERKIKIDMNGNVPGVYFVRFNNGKNLVSKKISFVPW